MNFNEINKKYDNWINEINWNNKCNEFQWNK